MLNDESRKVEATWCGVARGTEQRCEQLHRTLKRIVKARGALDAQEAAALREADELHLWRYYGHSSLLEYMELEMGYSPRAALERLRVAKAIEELPVIADKLTQGDLCFSAARELTRVVTPETEAEWLEAATDKNLREVEDLVSGRKRGDKPTDPADPKLRKRVLRYEVKPETVALVRQVQQLLEQERGERLDDDAFLHALCRQVLDAPHNERTRAAYQIAVITCSDCKRGWQDGGGLRVEMSPPTLERALCDGEYIGAVDDVAYNTDSVGENAAARTSKRRRAKQAAHSNSAGDAHHVATSPATPTRPTSPGTPTSPTSPASPTRPTNPTRPTTPTRPTSPSTPTRPTSPTRPTNPTSPTTPTNPTNAATPTTPTCVVDANNTGAPKRVARKPRARQSIPPALRRKIKRRDGNKCRVTACRSARNLDVHHIIHVEKGGTNDEANLLCLCEGHHLAHHDGSLTIEGDAFDATFTRRANHAFATMQRVVETTTALRTLGFKSHEVKQAMDRAKTHVGNAALSLDQWIAVALRYCPRPTCS